MQNIRWFFNDLVVLAKMRIVAARMMRLARRGLEALSEHEQMTLRAHNARYAALSGQLSPLHAALEGLRIDAMQAKRGAK